MIAATAAAACGDLAAVAKTLGVTEAKLRSALDAARPDPSAKGNRGAELTAAIAKELGQSSSAVQEVLDETREADGGGRRGPGDRSTLVAALTTAFPVSTEKAQAAVDAAQKAHEAEHRAREVTMAAAVAKDTAAVQKAFEAARPAPPTPWDPRHPGRDVPRGAGRPGGGERHSPAGFRRRAVRRGARSSEPATNAVVGEQAAPGGCERQFSPPRSGGRRSRSPRGARRRRAAARARLR